ncbi:hypothetical protein H9L39_07923 [Fusarium oxysporum f. sp. albedinis]|nr:hypothetical protein FocnCong_v021774 [Fusarium oxysporum f. sp. conglutinans]KAG7001833.1 hypothetical protein FocnCong_v011487 [Fusarium oxysporum f. sp. conglutinans]KAK2480355.1 hypothetical protein H9L39_07923 [Fusarium oxysporum f. sp. albedinis]
MPVIECSICLENFENEGAYRGHLEYHEHRAAELLQELRACMRHISAQPRLINGQSSPISQSSAINQPDTSPSRTRSWICPHPDCVRKLKRKSFERRKDLVRHAESHKDCEEECLFCEIPILKVRKYFTHYDKCPTRLEHQRTGILSVEKDDEMRKKRRDLHENTELWLNRLLPSGASNRAGGRRRRRRSKIPANVVEPSVTRHDAIHTNCHPRPNLVHDAPLTGGNAIQTEITTSNDPRATGLEVNKVDGNSIIASQDVSAFNDLLREMEFGYTASAPPTIDVSAMANHSILPRAPVVTCYTMDEPYYINPSRRSMELGISQFANGYVDGADRTG